MGVFVGQSKARHPSSLPVTESSGAAASGDNTGETNDCDLMKRERRLPPPDWRDGGHGLVTAKTGMAGSVTHLSPSGF